VETAVLFIETFIAVFVSEFCFLLPVIYFRDFVMAFG
jgi:hypothetical protein